MVKIKTLFTLGALALTPVLQQCETVGEIKEPGLLVPKTAEQDPTIPSINVNGAAFHSEAFGPINGPMVVVLHGGPGADYRYLLNCKQLADDGYRVVFFDQRGTGLSQRFKHSYYTLQNMLNDVSAVIEYYRASATQPIILLGHSWGAMLATAYINQYPESITGAVLAEPGGFIWQDIIDYTSRSREFSFFSEGLNDVVYLEQFLSGKESDHAILDYKYDLWAVVGDSKDSPLGNEGHLPFWRSGAVNNKAFFDLGEKLKPNWTTNLNQFSIKVLFIYSENNKAYGLAHAQKVSSAYSSVELFKTNDAGHDMLSFPTGWNNTYPVILEYLNSLQ